MFDHGTIPQRSPEFSVVITAYRRREYLREAITSVLNQTVAPSLYEIVVVKDFTDEDLDRWLASLGDRVRVLTKDLPRMGEMIAAGVRIATGRLICFLDDDDRFHQEKLARALTRFQSIPQLVMIQSPALAVDAQGHSTAKSDMYRQRRAAPWSILTLGAGGRSVTEILALQVGTGLSTMVVRADVIRAAIPWIERIASDPDHTVLALALSTPGVVLAESESWSDYRIHASTSKPLLDPDRNAGAKRMQQENRRRVLTLGAWKEFLARTQGEKLGREYLGVVYSKLLIEVYLAVPEFRISPAEWVRYLLNLPGTRPKSALVWDAFRGLLCPLKRVSPRRVTALITSNQRARQQRRWDLQ